MPAKLDDAPAVNATCAPVRGTEISFRRIARVDGFAVHSTSPINDPRLFVVEREGRVRIVKDEQLVEQPFIDLSALIDLTLTVERGLLGLAFHPRYATNGLFYVFYTTSTDGVVARCSVNEDRPDVAQPGCVPILLIDHRAAGNHNGGTIEFGPDGFLYIGTGDGGGAGDPNRRAQNPNDLLGKILRIDVDTRAPGLEYGVPADNPYASGGGRGEVFIRGVRNPWRFSFDRETRDLWIGDVGQNRAEELTVLRPAEQNDANLGWSVYEGNGCCATQDDRCLQVGEQAPCDPTGMVFPQDVRDRTTPRGAAWGSIIGGDVYRGECYPDLVGTYFYTDLELFDLITARRREDGSLQIVEQIDALPENKSTSIHADARGELFLTNISGWVYHLEVAP